MNCVLPLEKGMYVPSADIARMLHKQPNNFGRKLRALKEWRPDFVKRHCMVFGPVQAQRYSLDRIITVVMMIKHDRMAELDLLISTLECLERSDNEQFISTYILNFYKTVPDLRPEALPDATR